MTLIPTSHLIARQEVCKLYALRFPDFGRKCLGAESFRELAIDFLLREQDAVLDAFRVEMEEVHGLKLEAGTAQSLAQKAYSQGIEGLSTNELYHCFASPQVYDAVRRSIDLARRLEGCLL